MRGRRFRNGIIFVETRFVIVLERFLRRTADELNAAKGRETTPVQGHDGIVQSQTLVGTFNRGELLPLLRAETLARADDTVHRAIQRGQSDFFSRGAHEQATKRLDDLFDPHALLATMNIIAIFIDRRD